MREDIYIDDEDREQSLALRGDVHERFKWRCYASPMTLSPTLTPIRPRRWSGRILVHACRPRFGGCWVSGLLTPADD